MRKITNGFLVVMLLIIMVFGIDASQVVQNVYDGAGLFTSEEAQMLQQEAERLSEKLQIDLVIVTSNNTEGKTSRAYADDFYDYSGFGYGSEYDGVLLLIDMENREIYISTHGKVIRYLTDDRIEHILDSAFDYLSDEKYSEAAWAFLRETVYYVELGIPSNQYTQKEKVASGAYMGTNGVSSEPKEHPAKRVLMYLLIAILIGGVSVGVMAATNRGLSTTNAHTYLQNNSLRMINKYDRHTNTSVTHVTINTNSGGTGGTGVSTTHRSSSGRNHGGGGRKF